MPHWSRETVYYTVRAVMGEGDEKWPTVSESLRDIHVADTLEDWSSLLYELKAPITSNLGPGTPIIASEGFRIYPPFPLNRKASAAELFTDCAIPGGESYVTDDIHVPDHAGKGISVQHTEAGVVCHGLRIDTSNSFKTETLLPRFLALVRQYSMQWWVSSAADPFDMGIRMRFDLDRNFRPKSVLKHSGAGEVESTWGAMGTIQPLVNIEKPLDADHWQNITLCLQQGVEAETCVAFFLSAIENYRSRRDAQCILNLALMFETGENKARIMAGQRLRSKNKELLRDPVIATASEIKVFRLLITDRDNIAHGRPLKWAQTDADFERYLDSALSFIERYLVRFGDYGWGEPLPLKR